MVFLPFEHQKQSGEDHCHQFSGYDGIPYAVNTPEQGEEQYGSYAATIAHKDELIGTWKECKDNIKTWHDAAYYLLHNLYVTDTDVADASVDPYGEYEADYQSLVMPQIQYTDPATGATSTPYFFDSGYAYHNGDADNTTQDNKWTSAVTMDPVNHTITLNGNADGVALFSNKSIEGQNPSSWFPFLPTSGNNQKGETNTPHYLHDGAFQRKATGTTYRERDFGYALSGQGYFAYEPGLYFNFQGDDDVYVYINGQLVVDIGGTHGATSYDMDLDEYVNWAKGIKYQGKKHNGKTYTQLSEADKRRVDALCLVTGGVYSFDFFYMERHGIGANLRIMTNMKIVESGLDVDKQAWQNGVEIVDNGLVNVAQPVEYGFSITNNSSGKLYDLSFYDETIGITLDPENGLQYTGKITDSLGAKLTPAALKITVDGYDANGNKLDTVHVSCPTQDALKKFLQTLSSDTTQSGVVEQDYHLPYAGTGLWKNATVTIRGFYYTLTAAQQKVSNFTNSVIGSGFVKAPGENGNIESSVLRGKAKHTMYQPGQPSYYQWVGHPITIESERLYQDLLEGNVVADPGDLPQPGHMILIPSNANGIELASGGLSNTPGGNVYLTVNYQEPGSYMNYVTIRDSANPDYSLTVPITIYAVGGQDSTFVLDYGLDSYLTDNDAIFDYELDAAAGNVDGSVLGIAASDTNAGYKEYDTDKQVEKAYGQIANDIEIISGSYNASTGAHSGVVYELDTHVFLDHNKPWVIEFRAKHSDGNYLLFSGEATSSEGNFYIYVCPKSNGIYIGEHALEHIDVDGGGIGTDAIYNNYGIKNSTYIKNDANNFVTYKLVNEPDGAGGNTIYLYSGTTKVGAMDDYHQGNTAYSAYKDQTYLSGKDFTFNYMGTTGHPLDDIFEYVRVYEDGYQLTHYQWEMPAGNTAVNGVMNSANTNETGYVANTATYANYTTASGNHKNYWTLSQPVTLAHDQTWEISLTMEGMQDALVPLGPKDSAVVKSAHIYMTDNLEAATGQRHKMVHMGYRREDSRSHVNFGIEITEEHIKNFSFDDKHTYVFKNVVYPTGDNMVFLYVDGVEIGALDSEHWGGYDLQVAHTNGISGRDFTFHSIGCDNKLGFGAYDTVIIHNLTVRTKTTLSNTFEWVPGGSGLQSTVATDSTGNQIVFSKDTDGVVEAQDGQFSLDSKGLKFSVNDIMDGRYSAYVAMAIHEKGFAPTALEVDGIDIRYEAQMYKKITVLPANVVYYEDAFPAIHYYGTKANSFTALGNVSTDYSDYSDTRYFEENYGGEMTQSPDQDTPYGSDGVYQNAFTNTSGGSLHTIAINNDGPLAWFGFKGTGFELDARTSATEVGMIFVEIYNKDDITIDSTTDNPAMKDGYVDATPVRVIPLIPQFDIGNMIDGRFEMENGGSEAIYQVPVMQCADLDYGNYIVVICGVENLDYDNNMAHKDSYLFLDGIRIYNPLGTDAIPEYGDEQKVVFEEIRNGIVDGHILVSDYDESRGLQVGTALMTWTEKYDNRDYTGEHGYVGNAVSNVNDYLMDGPNNEVYLDGTFTNGALVFYVRQIGGADNILQLGVRAMDAGLYYGAGSTGMRANLMLGVMGTTASGTTEPGWHYIGTVASGTEQYYNIPYTLAPVVTIDGELYHQVVVKVDAYSNKIPAMVSFTNMKHSEGLVVCQGQFIKADKVDAEGNPVATGEIQGYALLSRLTTQMSAYRNFTINEAEPGSDFVVETPQTPDANAPTIIPGYPTLAFEGEVRYNIYFNVENMDDVSLEDMGLITFNTQRTDGTIADADDVIPGALFSGTDYMVHTNGIAAKNLGDTLYFKVYAKLSDDSYVYSSLLKYSALAYAQNRLEYSDTPELKSLVVAMLNYGAAAQQFFGYRTDALMNAGLTAEQQALAAPYSADMAEAVVPVDASKVGTFSATEGFKGGYASVSFTGAFMLNYYFTPDKTVDGNVTMYYWDAETYNGVGELTADNAVGKQTMTHVGNGEYVGSYTGMAAKEIGETVYVAVVYEANGVRYCSGVVAYNIDSYCAKHAANNASNMQELAAATTVYGYYAKNYFAN